MVGKVQRGEGVQASCFIVLNARIIGVYSSTNWLIDLYLYSSGKTLLGNNKATQAVVAHTFNPSTWEEEAGGSLGVQGQPVLLSEF